MTTSRSLKRHQSKRPLPLETSRTSREPRLPGVLALLLALLFSTSWATAQLPSTTLVDCPEGTPGDFTTRGFYIESYPGTTLDIVTLYFKTSTGSTSFPYQVMIVVTKDAYDGPSVGSFFTTATIGPDEIAVSIQCGNAPINPGDRLCFRMVINKQPSAPVLSYAVPPFDGPDCGVVQTIDTTAPLSTFRRNGVKISVTGRRNLEIAPGESIQSAIDAAESGDTIVVGAGTYDEELTLRPDVNVKGEGAGLVTLRASSGIAVLASSCTSTEFSGFTIMPAPGSTAETGFQVVGGSPLIKNNTIKGFPRYGIRIYGGSNAIVCGNRVLDNGDDGNGFLDYGILSLRSVVLLSNNLIKGNEVGCYIAFHESDGAQFSNNTVVDNSSDGLWCYQSNPIVKNNIVTGNNPGISASHSDATPTLTYNNVWNNTGFGNYSAQQTGVINVGTGSISVDPQFDSAHPDDDLLADGSPCIDAGDPAEIDRDLDGSRNDMGWTGGPCASPEFAPVPFGGFIFTSVGSIPANYIDADGLANVDAADAGALGITAWKNAPFASSPWLFGVFGSDVTPYYYTIEHKEMGEPDSSYLPLNHSLNKVKYTVSGGTITAALQNLGPNVISGVPYYRNTQNGGSIYWAHENLRLILNSVALPDSVYQFRVKAYNILQNEIALTSSPVLTLAINNKRPNVEIISISKPPRPAIDECAIVGLATPTENLAFRVTASHPDGFLDEYTLAATVGRNRSAGTIAADTYVGSNDATAFWSGVTNTVFQTSTAMTAGTLNEWESCAYQFRLTAWSRATNGYSRVYRSSYFFNLALNLGGGDLDGDGDVDGDDLAILAANYGSTTE
ncbi:right-handed parallel beta-helix repeat-containing protein [Verrucomicrobiaceae bacterium 227]